MSEDMVTIESDTGPYGVAISYFPKSREIRIAPEFRDGWRLPLRALLAGLHITLEDCRRALENVEG